MALDGLFRAETPATPVRGIHLDLKGVPPTLGRLLELLELFRAARINAVLVEWEDSFPWTVDQRFRSECAYLPGDVRRFAAVAARQGIEIIPLVQCLGHLETPLSVAGYEHLREVPHRADVLNPLADGAGELIAAMVDDVLQLLPDVQYFHLGGDEAWTFGTHPETKAYIEQHGKGALYLHHVEPLLDRLNQRDVRPILWHDMMREWDSDALHRLAGQADLCVWGYQGHPDTTQHHFASRIIERFKEHGVPLWGGTAYKGADGHNSDLPNPANRAANALAWLEVAERYGFKGVFATAWSRYSTHDVQVEPIDGALDCLLQAAVILHDGREPEGGIEACRAALQTVEAGARHEACRAALARLSAARQRGWTAVAHLREQVVMATLDSRRRTSGIGMSRLKALAHAVAEADAAAEEVRQSLEGLVDPLWIARYIECRIDPLREELGSLEPRARRLDPPGYAAEQGE